MSPGLQKLTAADKNEAKKVIDPIFESPKDLQDPSPSAGKRVKVSKVVSKIDTILNGKPSKDVQNSSSVRKQTKIISTLSDSDSEGSNDSDSESEKRSKDKKKQDSQLADVFNNIYYRTMREISFVFTWLYFPYFH